MIPALIFWLRDGHRTRTRRRDHRRRHAQLSSRIDERRHRQSRRAGERRDIDRTTTRVETGPTPRQLLDRVISTTALS